LNEVLKGANQCALTGYETTLRGFHSPQVVMYKSVAAIRLVALQDDTAVSGIILQNYGRVKTYQIKWVFTQENFRRKGLAKSLLCVARLYCGTVHHSQDLTKLGKLWAYSVG